MSSVLDKPTPKPRRSQPTALIPPPPDSSDFCPDPYDIPPTPVRSPSLEPEIVVKKKSKPIPPPRISAPPPPPIPPRGALGSPEVSVPEPTESLPSTDELVITKNNNGIDNPIYYELERLRQLEEFCREQEKKYLENDKCNSKKSGSLSIPSSPVQETPSSPVAVHRVSSPVKELLPESVTSLGVRASYIPVGQDICYNSWVRAQFLHRKEVLSWWCTLKNNRLTLHSSDTDPGPSGFFLSCDRLCFIGKEIASGSPATDPGPKQGYSFLLAFSTADQERSQLLRLTVADEITRRSWLMLLAKCCSPSSDVADLIEFVDFAGPVYTKQNTGGIWQQSWAFMYEKTLTYKYLEDDKFWIVDVRKVHGVQWTKSETTEDAPSPSTAPFLVSLDDHSLYIQTDFEDTSKLWKQALTEELYKPSNRLEEQRLTKDDVPVLVKKCVSFLDGHGLTVQGLHRLSGTSTKVRQLMEEFSKDAVGVHVRPEEYSVNDVASTLRRFLRELAEPLISHRLRPELLKICLLPEADYHEKMSQYQKLLEELPRVNYQTLRELLGHLKSLVELSSHNSMPVTNVASIFAKTLFIVDKDEMESSIGFSQTPQEIQVVTDLVSNFPTIFHVTPEEIGRRADFQRQILEGRKAKSSLQGGSLLVPIHLFELENEAFQKEVDITAREVVEFAVRHKNLPPGAYALFELVRGGQLRRLVFPEERLLDFVVKRWHRAESAEISGCHLLIAKDTVGPKLDGSEPYPFTREVRVADEGSKSFKKACLQCSIGIVYHYKDSKMSSVVHKWKVEDLLWFFGSESKRDAPYKNSLTFFDKEAVPTPSKFLGTCVCFKEESDMLRWLAAVLLVQRSPQP